MHDSCIAAELQGLWEWAVSYSKVCIKWIFNWGLFSKKEILDVVKNGITCPNVFRLVLEYFTFLSWANYEQATEMRYSMMSFCSLNILYHLEIHVMQNLLKICTLLQFLKLNVTIGTIVIILAYQGQELETKNNVFGQSKITFWFSIPCKPDIFVHEILHV